MIKSSFLRSVLFVSGGDEGSSDFEVVLDVTVRSSGVLRRLVGLGFSFVEDVIDDFSHSFDGDSLAFTDLSLFFSNKVISEFAHLVFESLSTRFSGFIVFMFSSQESVIDLISEELIRVLVI